MTNESDQDPSAIPADDETLRPRLDQARAELTGHPPTPDQRLNAMFLTGFNPVGQAGDPSPPTIELEPVGDPRSSSPKTRALIAAIAAAFLLVMGLAVYAAGRGDSDSPVEVAADTADSDTASPTESGSDALAQTAQDPDADAQDPDADGGWAALGPELEEQMKSLWSANRDWVDCLTDAVDSWAESPGTDGTAGLRSGLPLLAECGFPSFDELDLDELDLPDFDELDLPDFAIPGLDGSDMCETVETDGQKTTTCRWPELPDDFSFDDLGGLDGFDWREFLENVPGLEGFSFDLDHWDTRDGKWDPAPEVPSDGTDPEA